MLAAALIWYFGPPIRAFVERYLGWVALAFIVLLVGGFAVGVVRASMRPLFKSIGRSEATVASLRAELSSTLAKLKEGGGASRPRTKPAPTCRRM